MALTPDQEKLKEAALAADKNGHHVCVNARDSNNWEANQAWHYAANPAAILAILAQLEQVQGWVSVKERLPPFGIYVLVRHTRGTWHDSSDQANVNCVVVKLVSRKVQGNNLVPYEWNQFGPDSFFGQDISHWMAIAPPPEAA